MTTTPDSPTAEQIVAEASTAYTPLLDEEAAHIVSALRAAGRLVGDPTEEQIELEFFRARDVIDRTFGWKHLRRYGRMSEEWMDRLRDGIARAIISGRFIPAAAGVAPQEPSECSNPQCPLRRAHSGPCAPEGWSHDRENNIAKLRQFAEKQAMDFGSPEVGRWLNECADALAALAAPPVDQAQLRMVIENVTGNALNYPEPGAFVSKDVSKLQGVLFDALIRLLGGGTR